MTIWRNRRRSKAMQEETADLHDTAERLLEQALEAEARVDAQAQ